MFIDGTHIEALGENRPRASNRVGRVEEEAYVWANTLDKDKRGNRGDKICVVYTKSIYFT